MNLILDDIEKIRGIRRQGFFKFGKADRLTDVYNTEEGIRLTPPDFGVVWENGNTEGFIGKGARSFSIGDKVYILGGEYNGEYDPRIYEFLEGSIMDSGHVLTKAVAYSTIIEARDSVYIVGGETLDGVVGDVVKITAPDGDLAVEAVGSIEGLSRAMGTYIGGKGYLIGGTGLDGSISKDIKETVDGVTWTTVGSLDKGIKDAMILELGGFYYLLGGKDSAGDNSVIYKSIDGITWETYGKYDGPKGALVFVFKEKAYVFGGISYGGHLTTSVLVTDDFLRYKYIGKFRAVHCKDILLDRGLLVKGIDDVSILYGYGSLRSFYKENTSLAGSFTAPIWVDGDVNYIHLRDFGLKKTVVGDADIKVDLVESSSWNILREGIANGDIINMDKYDIYDLSIQVTLSRDNTESDVIFQNAKIYYYY